MANKTVADHMVERLRAWGVRRIFGYSGDAINGVIGALHRVGAGEPGAPLEFVQVAHEELASLMATAHAKFTNEVGVCLCTGGPAAIHLLNGLYDAKLDHVPVVAIVGQQAMTGLGGGEQQETNLHTLLQDVASAYVEVLATPEQLRHVVDRAFRIAAGERAVTAIIVPHDVQKKPAVEVPPHEHGQQHSAPGWLPPRLVPRDEDLRRAADVLNAGRKIAMLIGAGARGAGDEVLAVAERLGAGVAKALLGKDAVPDDLPNVTGSVGFLGTAASNRMMRECDTLLMVGTSFPYTEFLPEEGQARGVQIDVAPRNLALRYPVEVPLAGDAAETLRALLPLLRPNDGWRAQVEAWTRDAWDAADRHAMTEAAPVNPQRLALELMQRLPDGCILTADSGSSTMWAARHVRLRRGMQFSVSGGLATMGCAIPYATAAKLAHPDRAVIALVGDGAMQMSGLSALVDVAKHWRRWADPRLVVCVFNNRDLNFVTWEQRLMEGEPKFPASQDLPDVPYADYAKLLGLGGVRVERPEDVGAAWGRALAADRPFVIDAVVSADVPTFPPTLKPEQEDTLAKALAEDPDAAAVLEQMQRQEIAQRA
ncbi:thiamine pyrophosphate TPP-binding domain-containing protein [Gemmatirosa kalamazoonensis]|uniref:Thiamine pyrophosphate TPP-binding domain-containing protein n=1 Tax=Gemmatirosa kalamazoonensis TaxID=861299 RepID=W0RAV3_9BACT|nr:thiamine pyrophosphate-requiring protein [Gemmatirosa kalamazoonensis]AHG87921.1 thiamine pyrophosphate TPP-binding domain-containing protein [Gemmatirosa kalamazoonensis]